jgi:hypothetical protein
MIAKVRRRAISGGRSGAVGHTLAGHGDEGASSERDADRFGKAQVSGIVADLDQRIISPMGKGREGQGEITARWFVAASNDGNAFAVCGEQSEDRPRLEDIALLTDVRAASYQL